MSSASEIAETLCIVFFFLGCYLMVNLLLYMYRQWIFVGLLVTRIHRKISHARSYTIGFGKVVSRSCREFWVPIRPHAGRRGSFSYNEGSLALGRQLRTYGRFTYDYITVLNEKTSVCSSQHTSSVNRWLIDRFFRNQRIQVKYKSLSVRYGSLISPCRAIYDLGWDN